MSNVPPRHVCIAGAMLIALGTCALADTLFNLLNGKGSLELSILYLPVGYGILRGQKSSKTIGRVFAVIGMLTCLTVLAMVKIEHINAPWAATDAGEWDLIIVTVVPVFVLAYIYIVLSMSGHIAWFAQERKVDGDARTIFWSVFAGTLLAAGGHSLAKWQSRAVAENSFVYHLTVKPYDNSTGEGLRSVRYDADEIKNASIGKHELPQPAASVQSVNNQIVLHVLGVAANPFEFTLTSEGYREEKVRVEKASAGASEIRVPMEPLSQASGGVSLK